MSMSSKNNNIIVHDFTQKLNYFSKSNIFSGYLLDHNKSLNLRYPNQKKSFDNYKSTNKTSKNYIDKNYTNFKQRQSHSIFKQQPRYFFPSMDNNLLCENLFQRNSQILPSIQKMDKICQKKLNKKNSDFNAFKFDKKNSKRKTVFLSTTSFDIKKRENLIKSAKNNSQNNPNFFNTGQKYKMKYSLSKNIKPTKNTKIQTPKYKINYDISKEKTESFYFYIIHPENCGYLVKNCFKHRKNWKELQNPESKNYNFKWQQNNFGINFNTLSLNPNLKQMINHFEYKNAVSNKANLFLNMMEFAEMQEINVFKYVPFTILFDYNKVNFFNKIIKFELLYKNITNYIVPMYDINERKYKKDKERIYSFFFPCGNKIGSKTAINIPETHFVTSKIISDTNSENNTNNKIIKVKNNYWLIKAPDLNRGRCIKILNSLIDVKRSIREFSMGIKLGYLNAEKNDMEETFENYYNNHNYLYNYNNEENQKYYLNNSHSNNDDDNNNSISNNDELNYYNLTLKLKEREKELSPNYRSNSIIIQKYIENPLLYFGRKFDIRIWALLTQDLKIYVFKEGHLKCCSINYDLNSENTFCHLTNYSFQKYNSNFGKYESGNEASFDDLQKNIDVNYNGKYNFKKEIFPKIINIIQFVFESVKFKINPLDRKYSFEIFGFDFMIDSEFDPFLIEVNSNPGLEESSPLIKMLVPRMIDDALRLTLDKEFDTVYDFGEKNKYSYIYESPFPVEGYSNNDNLFKFVGDLYNDPNCEVYRNYINNNKPFFFRNTNKM